MNEIIVYLIQTLLSLFLLAMLLRFLLQLVRADFYNPISQFVAKDDQPPCIAIAQDNTQLC